MAYNAVPTNGPVHQRSPGPRRVLHDSAHDSALDVETEAEQAMRMRVKELEEENALLAEKATSASQRFADYENEIRVLRQRMRDQQERHNAAASIPPTPESENPPPIGLSRFGSFMRKPSLAPTPPPSGPSAREQELEATLVKEQTARIEAERKTKEMNAELEELSTTLFQQANDMVAAERRENAALKDKIKALEASNGQPNEATKRENERLKSKLQIMEQRELDRKRRLDKLEAAQKRIDRVRTMLVPR